MVNEQKQVFSNLESMVKSVQEQSQKVESDEISYKAKIKEVIERVSNEEEKKVKLEEKVAVARSNLKLLHEKNSAVYI